jgi:rhodanese-related sulfurtransferase
MKYYLRFFLLAVLTLSLGFTACDKNNDDDAVVVNYAQNLVEYLEQDDFVNTYMPAMISATDVKTENTAGTAYIIDIRSSTDYEDGHIPNAVNVALTDIVDHVETTDLTAYSKIVIACYSGQTASYATSILRLLGHSNVYCLKFGMCSWHQDFAGSWPNNVSNTYATQFTTDVTEKNATGSLPTFTTSSTDGAGILDERVDVVLGEWSDATITASAVFDNPSNYYIVNYWSPAHYELGHIPGAIQYTPKESMSLAADLKTLPTDKTIVVYCYTGQTSAHLTAFLRLLGYDAKSLLFGVNGMAYDWMIGHDMTHWDDAYIMGYDHTGMTTK